MITTDLLMDRFDLIFVLRKYLWLLIAVPALCVSLAYLYYLMQPTLFESSAVIYIDPKFDRIIQYESVEGDGNRSDLDSLKSLEIAIVGDSMVLRVLDRLGLREMEGFIPSGMAEKPDLSDIELIRFLQQERFSSQLVAETRLIKIGVLDPDASRARLIADTFASEFGRFLRDQKQDEAREAGEVLERQAQKARESALSIERRIGEFRKAHPHFPMEQDHDLFAQRLTQFSDELNTVVRQRMELESQEKVLAEVDSSVSPITVIELAGYQSMRHVSDLLSQVASAESRLAAVGKERVPSNNKYQAVLADLQRSNEQLSELAADIRQAVGSKYLATKNREEALREELDSLQRGLVEMKSFSSEFRALQQQGEREWLVHEKLQARLSESVIAEDSYSNVATMVSEPMEAFEKAQPSLSLLVLVGGGVGIFANIGWVMFCVLRGLPYTDRNQIEQRLGLPVIADWSVTGAMTEPGEGAVFLHGLSAGGAKSVHVSTPSLNGVGDSIAASIAEVAAATGARSLLVVIGPRQETGQAVEPRWVTSGQLVRADYSIQSAMQPEGLAGILDQVRDQFAYIFIQAGNCDDPEVERWLSSLADQNLVVVGKGGARKQAIDDHVDCLLRSGKHPVSLMMIDPRRVATRRANADG